MQFGKQRTSIVALAVVSAMALSPLSFAQSTEQSAEAVSTQRLPNFTALVKKAAPAVVNISTKREVSSNSMMMGPGQLPDIFRHFFGDQLPPGFSFGPGSGPGYQGRGHDTVASLGSGFIISQDGYILTNAHVVEGADSIEVKLNDRRQLKAKVIGSDKKTDVALIKVDANNLPVLERGNSNQLETGEWVAAIGSPFGFDHSVTSGIVSAINRTLSSDNFVPFIQTDVAINPGNSGGPLLNLQGQVVGINSQIYTRSGGFMGLSFAIPINIAMEVADGLKKDGHVHRGYLGAAIQEVSKDLATSLGLSDTRGALIAQLKQGAPGEKGGLKPGDVVRSVNGQEIDTPDELPRRVSAIKPGETATLGIVRDGKEQSLAIKVGDWPQGPDGNNGSSDRQDEQRRIGLVVGDLERDELRRLGVPHGVVVQQVDPDGAAANAGIQAGDVLVDLNRQAITSGEKLRTIVADIPHDRPVALRVARGGQLLFVALRLDNKQSDE
ncbi:DegQ family serine endoprotease [Carnimonas nigrificans]|uniref:DegQ family serine endoprotease n=1 Tax=Carnimonas nigrificans TaxID=64323 RepID=UPI0004B0CB52|nr:DegQ family serine endoprotease [Carnimonas nigrificans]